MVRKDLYDTKSLSLTSFASSSSITIILMIIILLLMIKIVFRNLSLYECQGWCREEPECQAASFRWRNNLWQQNHPFHIHHHHVCQNIHHQQFFSFVVNPLTPRQETICLLQV